MNNIRALWLGLLLSTPYLGCLFLMFSVTLMAGCTTYSNADDLTLYTTISSDGQMVATLSAAGAEKARLSIIRLNDEKGWVDLKAPPHTTSIKFGLNGRELLLTNDLGTGEISDLSKWDMDAPEKDIQRIYQANGLVFPIEVAPNEYLVRSCLPTSKQLCHRVVGVGWDLVNTDNNVIYKYRPPYAVNYSWPIVAQGQGFFWMKVHGEYFEDEKFPSFKYFAFPGGNLPEFNFTDIGKDTSYIYCDYKIMRCLRKYIKNWGEYTSGLYIFELEILTPNKRCFVPRVFGYFDDISLAPDGNSAVMSIASEYDKPRHVVVMHFQKGQCEPILIKEIQNRGS